MGMFSKLFSRKNLKIDAVNVNEKKVEKKNKPKSKYTWILDNGHGGVIDGVYQTKGKRSPKFENGDVLYEGVFNRRVVKKLSELL